MKMKFTKKFFFLASLLTMSAFIQTLQAQAIGDYRYKSNTTGNWSTVANWEKCNTASAGWSATTGWDPSTELPTTSATTRIVGSSNVTVDANTSVGQLDVYGTLTVNPSTTLTLSGTLSIVGASKTSANDGTITFGANAFNLNATNTFNNAGTITQSAGGFTILGTFNNNSASGNVNKTGGAFDVSAGGTINNSSTSTITHTPSLALTVAGTFNNSGTLSKSASTLTISSSGNLTNASTGTITMTNLTVSSGGTLTNNGTINRPSGTITFSGNYKGTGSFRNTSASGFTITNGGTIAPGNSPGTSTFANGGGNISLNNTGGTLQMEINGATAGTEFDQIVVQNQFTAAGTLNVNFGFTPTVGQTFQIISAGSYPAGSFTINSTPAHTLTYSAGVLTVTTVLPIELKKFDAKAQQKSTLLTWTTASEKDNALFKIQHSTNGVDFATISEMKGHGTNNVATDYNYEHSTPSVGINYYRLAQVDFNGTATYSPIRSVLIGKAGFTIKTTLVQSNLVVLTSDNDVTQLSIVNTAGQPVLNTKAQGEQAIDVSSLPSGLYFVRTSIGMTGRFVKQ